VQSEEDLVGGSSWRLLELTSVSRFLAYVRSTFENQLLGFGRTDNLIYSVMG